MIRCMTLKYVSSKAQLLHICLFKVAFKNIDSCLIFKNP